MERAVSCELEDDLCGQVHGKIDIVVYSNASEVADRFMNIPFQGLNPRMIGIACESLAILSQIHDRLKSA